MSITLAGYSLEVTGVRNQCLGFERFVKPLKTLAGYSLEVKGVRNLGSVIEYFAKPLKTLAGPSLELTGVRNLGSVFEHFVKPLKTFAGSSFQARTHAQLRTFTIVPKTKKHVLFVPFAVNCCISYAAEQDTLSVARSNIWESELGSSN